MYSFLGDGFVALTCGNIIQSGLSPCMIETCRGVLLLKPAGFINLGVGGVIYRTSRFFGVDLCCCCGGVGCSIFVLRCRGDDRNEGLDDGGNDLLGVDIGVILLLFVTGRRGDHMKLVL